VTITETTQAGVWQAEFDGPGSTFLPAAVGDRNRRRARATPSRPTIPGVPESAGATRRAIALGGVHTDEIRLTFGAIHVGSRKKAKVTVTIYDGNGRKLQRKRFKIRAGGGIELPFPNKARGVPGLYVEAKIKRAPVWTYLSQEGPAGDLILIPGWKLQ